MPNPGELRLACFRILSLLLLDQGIDLSKDVPNQLYKLFTKDPDRRSLSRIFEYITALAYGMYPLAFCRPIPEDKKHLFDSSICKKLNPSDTCMHGYLKDCPSSLCVKLLDNGSDGFSYDYTHAYQAKFNSMRTSVTLTDMGTFLMECNKLEVEKKIFVVAYRKKFPDRLQEYARAEKTNIILEGLSIEEILEISIRSFSEGYEIVDRNIEMLEELETDEEPVPVAKKNSKIKRKRVKNPSKKILREFQKEIVGLLDDVAWKGIRKIQVPTGGGKTWLAGWITARMLSRNQDKNAVMFVPGKPLAAGSVKSFQKHGLVCYEFHSGNKYSYEEMIAANVIICVYNSAPKLQALIEENPILQPYVVIVDEAHHIEQDDLGVFWGGRSERKDAIVEIISRTELTLELSATFHYEDSCLYSMKFNDAMEQGLLAETTVTILCGKGDEETLARHKALTVKNNPHIHRKILAYASSTDAARRFLEICIELHLDEEMKLDLIFGETPSHAERAEVFEEFGSSPGRHMIISVRTIIEGVDIPLADTCLLVSPKKSEISLKQCIGRVLRRIPGVKENAYVIMAAGDTDFQHFAVELARTLPHFRTAVENGFAGTRGVYLMGVEDDDLTEVIESIKLDLQKFFLGGVDWVKMKIVAKYYQEHHKIPGRDDNTSIRKQGLGGSSFCIGTWYHDMRKWYKNTNRSKKEKMPDDFNIAMGEHFPDIWPPKESKMNTWEKSLAMAIQCRDDILAGVKPDEDLIENVRKWLTGRYRIIKPVKKGVSSKRGQIKPSQAEVLDREFPGWRSNKPEFLQAK